MAGSLEGGNEAEFVFGRGAGEDVDFPGVCGEFGVGDGFQFVSAEGFLAVADAQGFADGAGGYGVVAGDHFDADAGTAAGGHGCDGLVAGRIDDAGDAEEGEAGANIFRGQDGLVLIRGADSDCEEALSEPGGVVHAGAPSEFVDRDIAGAGALGGASREDGFRRSFHDDECAVAVAVESGHEFVRGVERDGGDARVSVVELPRVESGFQAERDERAFGRLAFEGPASFLLVD